MGAVHKVKSRIVGRLRRSLADLEGSHSQDMAGWERALYNGCVVSASQGLRPCGYLTSRQRSQKRSNVCFVP